MRMRYLADASGYDFWGMQGADVRLKNSDLEKNVERGSM